MATLTATTPTRTGTVTSGAAVASTDIIPASVIGSKGCILEIINGNASPDTVTVGDSSITAAGSPAAAISKSVTNGTSQAFKILPEQGDQSNNGQVQITHTITSTVTYKLYPLG